jgi:transketolase
MRDAFAQELTKLADVDERVVLLSGDIGNRMFDAFKERHPGRFFNCGVAEANMTSVAAGMALCGLRPVTYTIAAFNTIRCLEQIRMDLCYHGTAVVLVGVGAGLSYAENGASHHCCEDIAALRSLPGMTVVCPADRHEVRAALRAALQHNGPVYLRLGKKGEPDVHSRPPDFRIGKAIVVRPGRDVCLIGTGNMLPTAMQAASLLNCAGLSAEVVSFHTVKPLDEALLSEVFSRFRIVVTLEEHSRLGGLGGGVAEWLADGAPVSGCLLRLGTDDRFLRVAGRQQYARQSHGLDAETITRRIQQSWDACNPAKEGNA